MAHLRISVTEPKKLKSDVQKVSKQSEAKTDGVINSNKNTISINFKMENFDALKTLRIDRSRP